MEVTYVDHMGSDARVVNAARVSFLKNSEDYTLDSNQKLIRFLASHNHWTPFSHVQITLHEKVPIFVARQRFKHMVGFTYNEVSRRYVDDPPEFYFPSVWRDRPDKNVKQGSGSGSIETLELDEHIVWDDPRSPYMMVPIRESYKALIDHAETLYYLMIKNDVAPEQARMVLPQSMYTEYYCTGSLAAWARAFKLRIDSHAQKEIQELAEMWDREITKIADLKYSWEVLKDG